LRLLGPSGSLAPVAFVLFAVVPMRAARSHTMGGLGMDENVAGLLSYSLGWITGLIFYLVDKRPFVRFHAAQSMVVFGALHIVYYILVRIFFSDFLVGGFGFAVMLLDGIRLLGTVLWIVLMVKAYQHEKFRVPVAAEIADNIAGRGDVKL
jgi:uncharacterized membrane protein